MKGVYFSSKLPNLTEIRDLPIPQPGDDEILIKNVAVASNPKDWKVPLWMPDWSAVEGNDVAGYVEAVGKNVQEFKKGDKVAAFSVMRSDTKYGA
jgi:NADPH:quinone reductase-like Zn-dependent oxidoreductase